MVVSLPEVHVRALSALHDRIRVLAGREDRARRALHSLEQERERLEAERAALELVEGIYRRTLGINDDAAVAIERPDPGEEGPKKRARVGPQRYVMLAALRASRSGLKINQIAELTLLNYKRVKDQMANDLSAGVVTSVWDAYQLTNVGLDLLSRYESYKASKNEPLPSAENASAGSDAEEDFE